MVVWSDAVFGWQWNDNSWHQTVDATRHTFWFVGFMCSCCHAIIALLYCSVHCCLYDANKQTLQKHQRNLNKFCCIFSLLLLLCVARWMIPCCILYFAFKLKETKERKKRSTSKEEQIQTEKEERNERTTITLNCCWARWTSAFAMLMNSSRRQLSISSFFSPLPDKLQLFLHTLMFRMNAYTQLCRLFPIRFSWKRIFFSFFSFFFNILPIRALHFIFLSFFLIRKRMGKKCQKKR